MHLPVLMSSVRDDERAALAAGLREAVRGSVRFGRHDRMLYATDASMYQVEPIGVVVPADEADVVSAVEFCAGRGVAMLPRGGGTSLAGQCTNHAVVIDGSAGLKAVGRVDVASRSVRAQAGVAIDDLNAEVARQGTGLFFAPDPATVAQATVGGCIGNNASGSRSVLYGRTVDSVAAIDAVLASGARVTLRRGAGRDSAIALKLADGVSRIVRAHERLIRERFPKTLRRNAGYALDLILKQLDEGVSAEDLDLVPLLCGSEGTLAITLGATLRLFAVPKGKGLALVSFASVDEAIAVVPALLKTKPSAVELIDDVVIEAALGNLECAKYVEAFPRLGDGRLPSAVLYVEYHGASMEEIRERMIAARGAVGAAPMREVLDGPGMADAWKLRKAGEPLLHGLPGHRKPLTFIEDNAVPVENLARFVRELRAIVEAAGTRAAFWAHASVGVLHVRPLLDPHDPADLEKLRDIAVKAADLARDCGGVMSGEHGDGKVRGPLIERFYGRELCEAFAQVKRLFDPQGLLNPGNIVGAGPISSITERTRIEPLPKRTPQVPNVATYYGYEDQEDFGHAVEMCNGAGVCRKSSGGSMCPSYRGTLDERHSTRGRGNALRLAITGQARVEEGVAAWDDPETMATLDLCLSCKACKSECPSNVDISKLKAEYTAQRYKQTGSVPLNALLTGHVRILNRIGSLTPGLANWGSSLWPVRALINRVMKIDARRSLPKFSRSLYSLWGRSRGAVKADAARVVLYADCFTTYNESQVGLAARSVLEKLGYRVELPKVGCCGRSMISVGMLRQAIDTIDATLSQLKPAIEDPSVAAILVCEPSCLSAIKDDWLTLRCATPRRLREQLAAKAMLVEEFVDKRWNQHPLKAKVRSASDGSAPPPVVLHVHCHQKALWGTSSSAAALRRVLGDQLSTPDTGCCGMAGSFGFAEGQYDLSMRVANLDARSGGPGGGILPHVRDALAKDGRAVVAATGTSCRHQIADGTGEACHAVHPVEILDAWLE